MSKQANEIEAFQPGDDDYSAMHQMAKDSITPNKPQYDYGDFARRYNELPTNSVIVVPDEATQVPGNLRTILSGRNLKQGEDYVLSKPGKSPSGESIPGKDRRLIVTKLSDTKMRVEHKSTRD